MRERRKTHFVRHGRKAGNSPSPYLKCIVVLLICMLLNVVTWLRVQGAGGTYAQEASTAKNFPNCVSNFEIAICNGVCYEWRLITSIMHTSRNSQEQFLPRSDNDGAPFVVYPGLAKAHVGKKQELTRENSLKRSLNYTDVRSSSWLSKVGANMNTAVRLQLVPDILAQEKGRVESLKGSELRLTSGETTSSAGRPMRRPSAKAPVAPKFVENKLARARLSYRNSRLLLSGQAKMEMKMIFCRCIGRNYFI